MDEIIRTVQEHLASIKETPSKPIDVFLLQRIDQTASNGLSPKDRFQLLGAAQVLLPDLQQDPAPLAAFIVRLIEPESVAFEEIDTFLSQHLDLSVHGTSDYQYIRGLESDITDLNILVLTLLHKARVSPSSMGIVANKGKVVFAIIKLFLTSPDTAVSEKAGKLLEDFILAGETPHHATPETNLIVRRIFRDREVYESIFFTCSLKNSGVEGQPSKRQKTIAQSRLLDFLVDIDHPSSPIRVSQFLEIEQQYGVTDSTQGLLYYAFVKMMDLKDDDLLLSTFYHSCARYISKIGPFGEGLSDYALAFLKENNLHAMCISSFMNFTPEQNSWLVFPSAAYLSLYCERREDDLLKDTDFCTQIINRISRQFRTTSVTEWQTNDNLKIPLMVLGSLPRRLNIPASILSTNDLPPLFDVPAYTINPHVLSTLRHMFCEPREPREPQRLSQGTNTPRERADRMMSRVLYLKYVDRYPEFWDRVVHLAKEKHGPEPALSAISFMQAFVNADWEPVDQSLAPYLPSEDQLRKLREGDKPPATGLEAMLLNDGEDPVITYLMSSEKMNKPSSAEARRRAFDSKDPGDEIVMAKYSLILRVRHTLAQDDGREGAPPLMKDMLDWFNEKSERFWREQREDAVQGGAHSVATMRR